MLKKFILRLLGKDKLYKMNKVFRKRAKRDIKIQEKEEKKFKKAVKSALKNSEKGNKWQ